MLGPYPSLGYGERGMVGSGIHSLSCPLLSLPPPPPLFRTLAAATGFFPSGRAAGRQAGRRWHPLSGRPWKEHNGEKTSRSAVNRREQQYAGIVSILCVAWSHSSRAATSRSGPSIFSPCAATPPSPLGPEVHRHHPCPKLGRLQPQSLVQGRPKLPAPDVDSTLPGCSPNTRSWGLSLRSCPSTGYSKLLSQELIGGWKSRIKLLSLIQSSCHLRSSLLRYCEMVIVVVSLQILRSCHCFSLFKVGMKPPVPRFIHPDQRGEATTTTVHSTLLGIVARSPPLQPRILLRKSSKIG